MRHTRQAPESPLQTPPHDPANSGNGPAFWDGSVLASVVGLPRRAIRPSAQERRSHHPQDDESGQQAEGDKDLGSRGSAAPGKGHKGENHANDAEDDLDQ
jgi:hypothetical protein